MESEQQLLLCELMEINAIIRYFNFVNHLGTDAVDVCKLISCKCVNECECNERPASVNRLVRRRNTQRQKKCVSHLVVEERLRRGPRPHGRDACGRWAVGHDEVVVWDGRCEDGGALERSKENRVSVNHLRINDTQALFQVYILNYVLFLLSVFISV